MYYSAVCSSKSDWLRLFATLSASPKMKSRAPRYWQAIISSTPCAKLSLLPEKQPLPMVKVVCSGIHKVAASPSQWYSLLSAYSVRYLRLLSWSLLTARTSITNSLGSSASAPTSYAKCPYKPKAESTSANCSMVSKPMVYSLPPCRSSKKAKNRYPNAETSSWWLMKPIVANMDSPRPSTNRQASSRLAQLAWCATPCLTLPISVLQVHLFPSKTTLHAKCLAIISTSTTWPKPSKMVLLVPSSTRVVWSILNLTTPPCNALMPSTTKWQPKQRNTLSKKANTNWHVLIRSWVRKIPSTHWWMIFSLTTRTTANTSRQAKPWLWRTHALSLWRYTNASCSCGHYGRRKWLWWWHRATKILKSGDQSSATIPTKRNWRSDSKIMIAHSR